MYKLFMDAFIDTAKMIPLLLIVYTLIGYMEGRFSHKLVEKVRAAGKSGPLLGTVFGIIPQCGFSVISTALYTKRALSLGTLLAVYLSTSDEAIPVIMAQPEKAGVVLPLLGTKAVIAVLSGYLIDIILTKTDSQSVKHELCATAEDAPCANQTISLEHEDSIDVAGKGCCGHDCASKKPMINAAALFHPLIHTLKVFLFIFAASLIINIIIFEVGANNLHKIFLGNSILQPFIVALIGLIPNCASSVAITEIFLKGGISFGSTVAGLSASSGLGLLILFKENNSLGDTLKIIGLLFAISVISGTVLHLLYT